MNYETIILDKQGNIATLTLNRPEKLNALNPRMQVELDDAFRIVNQDDKIRALVITGAGRGFCAGGDIKESFQAGIDAGKEGGIDDSMPGFPEQACLALVRMVKPVIAAINGVAVGFGCTLSLACDIRIASEAARFSVPFPRVGLVPECGSTYFLSRLVGIGKACELVFTGRMVDANEAKEIGLVNQVVPTGELIKSAYEMASSTTNSSPLAMQLARRGLYQGMDTALATQLRYETLAQIFLRGTADFAEATRAFLEKRDPVFTGR